eukprot:SAG31_NODE_17727_length_660_cov_0.622103_1_plen_75_part_10
MKALCGRQILKDFYEIETILALPPSSEAGSDDDSQQNQARDSAIAAQRIKQSKSTESKRGTRGDSKSGRRPTSKS